MRHTARLFTCARHARCRAAPRPPRKTFLPPHARTTTPAALGTRTFALPYATRAPMHARTRIAHTPRFGSWLIGQLHTGHALQRSSTLLVSLASGISFYWDQRAAAHHTARHYSGNMLSGLAGFCRWRAGRPAAHTHTRRTAAHQHTLTPATPTFCRLRAAPFSRALRASPRFTRAPPPPCLTGPTAATTTRQHAVGGLLAWQLHQAGMGPWHTHTSLLDTETLISSSVTSFYPLCWLVALCLLVSAGWTVLMDILLPAPLPGRRLVCATLWEAARAWRATALPFT